jgi:hypothetical protein
MPEATVHEDRRPKPGKHDVWPAEEAANMKSKSEPRLEQLLTHEQLRSGVCATYRGHHTGSLRRLDGIRHARSPICFATTGCERKQPRNRKRVICNALEGDQSITQKTPQAGHLSTRP